jgi:hypothetical protein
MNAIGERGICRHLSLLFERTANIPPWYGPEQPTTSRLVLDARPVGPSVSFCKTTNFAVVWYSYCWLFGTKEGEIHMCPSFSKGEYPSLNFLKMN